ncbi:hypothetical protein GOV08_02205 [Candidatus Woesearchaeota archaeon]|nr:hypothetical protein [Candidatus Woesearchaeota archaeon]
MALHFYAVIVINIILNIIIIGSGTSFFLKVIYDVMFEQKQFEHTHEGEQDSTNEVFFEQLQIFRKKFWLSFYVLEASLFTYFIFWGLLFSGVINVVF